MKRVIIDAQEVRKYSCDGFSFSFLDFEEGLRMGGDIERSFLSFGLEYEARLFQFLNKCIDGGSFDGGFLCQFLHGCFTEFESSEVDGYFHLREAYLRERVTKYIHNMSYFMTLLLYLSEEQKQDN